MERIYRKQKRNEIFNLQKKPQQDPDRTEKPKKSKITVTTVTILVIGVSIMMGMTLDDQRFLIISNDKRNP